MKKIQFSIRYFLIGLFIIIIFYIFWKFPIFKNVAATILISYVISYALRPIQRFLMSKGISRRLSIFIIIFAILAFVIGSIVMIIPWFYREGANLKGTIGEFKSYYDGISNSMSGFMQSKAFKGMAQGTYDRFKSTLDTFADNAIDGLISIAGNMMLICIAPLIVYFFLSDGENIYGNMMKYLPIRNKYSLRITGNHIDKVMGKYVISQFELCAIIGIMTYIVLFFTKIKFPFLLSSVNAVFNIIPYFGPVIGAIPIIIITLLTSTKKAIIVTVWLTVIQQVEGDIIGPKVLGDSVDSHPLTVLLLLIIGENLWGIFGMVLIVPIWTMGKIILKEVEAYLF